MRSSRHHHSLWVARANVMRVWALPPRRNGPDWQAKVAALAGHTAAQSGEVLSLRRGLPWWDYRQQKTGTPHLSRATPGALRVSHFETTVPHWNACGVVSAPLFLKKPL